MVVIFLEGLELEFKSRFSKESVTVFIAFSIETTKIPNQRERQRQRENHYEFEESKKKPTFII